MGASATTSGQEGSSYLFGASRRRSPTPRQADVVASRPAKQIGRKTFEQLASRAETLAPPKRGGGARPAGPRRAMFRWNRIPPRQDSRTSAPTSSQGEAGATAAWCAHRDEEETSHDRPEAMREWLARTAARRDPGHRLRVHGPEPRDCRGRGPAWSAPEVLTPTAVQGQGGGPLESGYETTGASSSGTTEAGTGRTVRYGHWGSPPEPPFSTLKAVYERRSSRAGPKNNEAAAERHGVRGTDAINLLYPELSGLISTLRGTTAGGRSLSRTLFTGYGGDRHYRSHETGGTRGRLGGDLRTRVSATGAEGSRGGPS